MKNKEPGRREFLKDVVLLAGLSGGAFGSASAQTPATEGVSQSPLMAVRAYGDRSRFENVSRDWLPSPTGRVTASFTPHQDSRGIITPSALHFEIHHSRVPEIDPRQHRLLLHGLVDRSLIFTMADLKRLPSVSRIYFIECAGNSARLAQRTAKTVQFTHGLTSCSEWTGVPLSVLLEEAGVQREAQWLVAEGADAVHMTRSIPLKKALDDVLVAYYQNGEALRPEQGYPLRLVIPGWEGNTNVKWLRRIKLVEQPAMTREETSHYTDLMPDGAARQFTFAMDPKSVITYPSGGHKLSGPGYYQITGLAWSGRGGVRSVEISTDGGVNWASAKLQEPVLRFAHVRFHFDWKWNGEEALLQSRCTDDRGETQPALADFIKARGLLSGYHFNTIQRWRVARDGSVINALG